MSMTCLKLSLVCTSILGLVSCFFLISLEKDNKSQNLKWKSAITSPEEKEQEIRLSRLKSGCSKLANRPLTDLVSSRLDHFILDDAHRLIYCYVPKVACTNWKRVLLALRSQASIRDPLAFKSNETHLHNVFVTLDQVPKDQALQKLQSYKKFVFVRNPYERLLSAYRNKFEKSYSDYFLSRFGRRIVKLYRQNASADSIKRGHDVRFSEFLQYVSNLNTSKDKIEFNEHWRPIADLCFPCTVHFDVIGKYESLISDAEYTLKYAGVENLVVFPRRDQTYNRQPSSELLAKYYSGIPESILQQLRVIYKDDLQLFGYSLNPSI